MAFLSRVARIARPLSSSVKRRNLVITTDSGEGKSRSPPEFVLMDLY